MSTIAPVTHRLDIPDPLYKALQKLSGKKNCKPYIMDLLNAHVYNVVTGAEGAIAAPDNINTANINTAPNDATRMAGNLTSSSFVNLDAPQRAPRFFDDRLRARR